MFAGKIGHAATGSPQPPTGAEAACCKLDVTDVGSTQPPPGGGLHPRAARKQAPPLGCGPLLRLESISLEVGGPQPPPRGGPQAVPGLAGTPQAAVRTSNFYTLQTHRLRRLEPAYSSTVTAIRPITTSFERVSNSISASSFAGSTGIRSTTAAPLSM